jgi:hypothetical protein
MSDLPNVLCQTVLRDGHSLYCYELHGTLAPVNTKPTTLSTVHLFRLCSPSGYISTAATPQLTVPKSASQHADMRITAIPHYNVAQYQYSTHPSTSLSVRPPPIDTFR